MEPAQLKRLKEDFADYFQIEHSIAINAQPFAGDGEQLSDDDFLQLMPEPFRLASEQVQLNSASIRNLSRLGEAATELSLYLQQLAKKVDLMMHYILQQQDRAEDRYYTHSYGGSGLCLLSKTPFAVGDWLQLKVFLAEGEGAVFCLGQVLECRQQNDGADGSDSWQCDVVFRHIRELDQELIVRASLHEQTRQLKLKKQLRDAAD
ncbi:PilZ domain-containing protein [Alkalimonas delamerensis]|uniref:PilZ domain-containing protein n=1 Tax=Alkalimonas delamerensis TaxID=265981 RepID=A0ABT9GPP4_9GAMM|nr:PilZ domain-containing protein [Alkalimonas delamerensis]MDP4528953.1 PilZ domain-containing protein [Alkalimonas delamerensis]